MFSLESCVDSINEYLIDAINEYIENETIYDEDNDYYIFYITFCSLLCTINFYFI